MGLEVEHAESCARPVGVRLARSVGESTVHALCRGSLEPKLNSAFIWRSQSGRSKLFTGGSASRTDNSAVNALHVPDLAGGGPPGGAVLRAMLTALSTVMLLTGLSPPAAWAGDEHDHERARVAVQAGEVLPLPKLLAQLRRTHPGKVLELELTRADGRWIYEVKLLQAKGQLQKLELDAGSGQELPVKRRQDRSKDRKGETSNGVPK
jgi:hypothetical protein